MMTSVEMSGYLVSAPIPWNADGQFAESQFQDAIRKLRDEGCDGLYLFGTSGEGYAVSDQEFAQIIEAFSDATEDFAGFRQAGCFGLSSQQVMNRCGIAAELGLQSVQITLPFWKGLSDVEVAKYFQDVCGSFPSLSFLLYNNPRNKRRLKGRELQSLQNDNPNFVAVKTGSGNWFDFYELITESPSLQHFVTEPAFLFCSRLGVAGLIPSSNYALPNQCRNYYEAVIANELETAHGLQTAIVRFFHETAIPLLSKGYIDGAIDKAYARLGGMGMPLHMKSPYTALTSEDFAWLESIVHKDFPDQAAAQ